MRQRAATVAQASPRAAQRAPLGFGAAPGGGERACRLPATQIRRRRSRAVRILLVILGALLVFELGFGPARVRQWGSWTLRLVFPSRDVTGAKVLCLVGGLALTFYYLVVADSHRQCGRSRTAATASRPSSPRTLSPRADKALTSSAERSLSSACETRSAVPATPGLGVALGPTPLQPMVEHELPQLKLANECQSPGISSNSAASSSIHVNGKEPIPFENDLFKGQLLFLVRDSTPSSTASAIASSGNARTTKREAMRTNWSHLFNGRRRTLWIQVQGQFKRVPPPDTTLFLAAEVTAPLVVGFWTRKLIDVLASVMKTIARNVHIAFGEASDSDELPHAAFPLYECADEVVETPVDLTDAASMARAPMLGIENFGESPQQRDLRVCSSARKTFALDRIYTFQCYTMYADLAQWQVTNLPGMPEIPLKKLIGDQPVRLAAYMAPTRSSSAAPAVQHTSAVKDYLFCFSVRYSEEAKRARAASGSAYASLTPSMLSSSGSRATTPPVLCSPTASSLRSTLLQEQQLQSSSPPSPSALVCDEGNSSSGASADCVDESQALPQKLAQHEQALQTLKFALPMWIEQVDRVAGNRKVSYLFVVEEKQPVDSATAISSVVGHRYTVVRSAATIKNALLLLQDADVGAAADEARGSSGVAAPATRNHEDEFRKLLVESREFLYETISGETLALADALQKIASAGAPPTSSSSSSAGGRLARLKKAMLYHCLKSSGTLPSVRAPQDIGIQLTQAKRERMDIICECGVYRVHMPRLLRQEWLVLTTSDVLFFRSYSMRACKSVPITELLRVQAVDAAHVLSPEGCDRDGDSDSTSWHCVELHLLCEIVTVFFDSKTARRQFVASLNQIALLRARPGCLPALRALETQALPLCLNRRNMLSELGSGASLLAATTNADAAATRASPLALVRDALEKGLAVSQMDASTRRSSDLLPFLDAVELLADMVLPGGDDAAVLSVANTSATDTTAGVLSPPVPQLWAAASSAVLPFSHEEKLAFALNLYHVLYIHATLVFAMPTSPFQWKKMQTVPCYIIGRAPHHQWRVTLDVIENELLRVSAAPPGSTSTSSSSSIAAKSSGAAGSARKLLSLGKSSSVSSGAGTIDGSVPRHLAITHPDFRTSFALQMNCSPGTHVMRVYDASQCIHEQLNATCARFLSRELRVDAAERTIWLPRIVEWRQQDFLPRTTRSKKDASAALVAITTGIGASTDARTFYCLQKLLGFLEETQRDRVQSVLIGAGKSARIVYDSFWTQPSGGSASASSASSIKLRSSKSERSPSKSQGAHTNALQSSGSSATSARQFFQAFF